jgi:hypothetical protein
MDLKKSIQQDLKISLQNEILSKINLATQHSLLPKFTTEIDFNIDVYTGNCDSLEYWKCADRLQKDHRRVEIPKDLLEDFVFKSFSDVVRS